MPKPTKSVKWCGSKVREILLDDPQKGIISLDKEVLFTEQSWQQNAPLYLPLFDLHFLQFKRQLKTHRKKIRKENFQNLNVAETGSNFWELVMNIKWLVSN